MQHSFAAGELSPGLHARTDLAKYDVGAARLRNFLVDFKGGASNRPGTKFIGITKFQTNTVLIPFQFSTEQTYLLEFGNLYMRVIRDGGYVLEGAKTITNITNANPAVVTSAAHGYSNGQWVHITGVAGMTQINNQTYIVAGAAANTFQLTKIDGSNVNSTAYGVYTSGGSAFRHYEIVTPYLAADLDDLKFTQSADVMTLTHPSYAPRDLTRTGHTAWTLTTITFASSIAAPGGLLIADNWAGASLTEVEYVVTAVADNGDESVASTPISIVSGYWPIDGPAGEFSIRLDWTAVAGASYYNIYRAPYNRDRNVLGNPSYGLIGTTEGNEYLDTNLTADYSTTPPKNTNPFNAANKYPGVSEYFQQRKVFARTNQAPQTFWLSQVGSFNNMNASFPIRESDSINATLNTRQVNEVKHLISMPDGLIALTSGSAFRIWGGGPDAPITPSNLDAKTQAYTGASDVRPVLTGYDIFYVQSKGSAIRILNYNYFANAYTGDDITVNSGHLFEHRQIVSMTFAEEPHKVLWAVRDDGILLSFTYLKEQEVAGWAWHDTDGFFLKVASIPEGSEDAVYFIVKRKIGTGFVQMIERLASRKMKTVEDAWFLDSALSNALTYPAAILTMNAASGNTKTADSSVAVFAGGDVGKVIRAGGGRFQITGVNTPSRVTGNFLNPVEELMGNGLPVPFDQGEWSMDATITSVSGLEHLEGKTVNILGDGKILTSQVVASGAVTLSEAVSKVVIGLGFTAQLQTLRIDTGLPTIQGMWKKLSNLTLRLRESRAIDFGPTFDAPDLLPMKEETPEISGQAKEFYTKDREVIMSNNWTKEGQVCLQITAPLPVTVLGIIPETRVGKTETSNN